MAASAVDRSRGDDTGVEVGTRFADRVRNSVGSALSSAKSSYAPVVARWPDRWETVVGDNAAGGAFEENWAADQAPRSEQYLSRGYEHQDAIVANQPKWPAVI